MTWLLPPMEKGGFALCISKYFKNNYYFHVAAVALLEPGRRERPQAHPLMVQPHHSMKKKHHLQNTLSKSIHLLTLHLQHSNSTRARYFNKREKFIYRQHYIHSTQQSAKPVNPTLVHSALLFTLPFCAKLNCSCEVGSHQRQLWQESSHRDDDESVNIWTNKIPDSFKLYYWSFFVFHS